MFLVLSIVVVEYLSQKKGSVYTCKEWGKRNVFPGWLFYRKCKMFGGCLYDKFDKVHEEQK